MTVLSPVVLMAAVVPTVTIEVIRGLSSKQCGEVQALCEACAAANLGTAMIFAIADEVKDWLLEPYGDPTSYARSVAVVKKEEECIWQRAEICVVF